MIEKISSKVLTDWGFDYDGYYWTHPNVPFKLNVANGGEAYYITVEERYNTGKVPPPVKNTCDLFMLVSGCFDFYVTNRHEIISNPDQLQKMLDDYLASFNSKLKSIVSMKPGDRMPSLHPGNEYTFTLASGMQSHFTVTYSVGDGEMKTEELEVDPRCVSNTYLRKYFKATKICSVKVRLMDGTDEDYFGMGLG
jgi:hypothetical protein